MKLVFNTLSTDSGSIEVSFDGGLTWISYNVSDLRNNNNEIVFSEEQCPDLTKIQIKGKFKTYSDIDALYNPNTIVTVAKGDSDSTISSTAVVSYVDNQIGSLNQDQTGSRGSYIEAISETGGIITATSVPLDTVVNEESTHNTAPSSKAVYAVLQNIGNVYNIKEGVATKDDLPTEGNTNGDVRACQDTGVSYVWIDDKWSEIGGASLNTALDFTGANIEGEDTAFITQVTQNDGLISATKASIPKASLTEAGIVKLSDSLDNTSTTVAATANTVATLKASIDEEISDRASETSSLKLSLNNEISNRESAITEEVQYRNLAIKQALASLSGNVNCTAPSTKSTIAAFKQTNGNVSVVFKPIQIEQSQVTGLTDALETEASDRNTAIAQAVAGLYSQTTGKDGAYIKTIKESSGIITTSVENFDTSLDVTSSDNNAPTSKAVYNAIMNEASIRDDADKAEATARNKAIEDSINALDVESVGKDGSYIQTVSETDGKITATLKSFDTELDASSDNNNVPTSKAVYDKIVAEAVERNTADTNEVTARNNAIKSAIEDLDVTESGSDGSYIQKISETDGKVSTTLKAFDTEINDKSTNGNAPSSLAVYTAIQNLGNVYHIKDSVESESALPTTGNTAGDVRNCNDTGDNYVWTGTAWDRLGGASLINTLNYTDTTASGTATSFITNVTQTNGKISATKSTIPSASTTTAGIVKLNNTTTSTSTTEAATAAVAKSLQDSITAEVSNRKTAISDAINALDVTATSGTGYISSISETDGKVSATYSTWPTFNQSTTGNAATATKATADADGNTITTTYETKTNAAKHYSTTMVGLGFTAGSTVDVAVFLNKIRSTYDYGSIITFGWADANAAYITDGTNTTELISGYTLYLGLNGLNTSSGTWTSSGALLVGSSSRTNIYQLSATISATAGTVSGKYINRIAKYSDILNISSITYQSGTSATTAPTGNWSTTVPSITQGNYLWTKITYSDSSVAYSVAYQGKDGESSGDVTFTHTVSGSKLTLSF